MGLAVVEGKLLHHSATWDVRGHKGKWLPNEIPDALYSYMISLRAFIKHWMPIDTAVVEELSVTHNMDTVRKIAYFEAASLLACAGEHIPTYSVKATTARKVVLGKGSTKKAEIPALMDERYGLVLPENEADAFILASWAQPIHV